MRKWFLIFVLLFAMPGWAAITFVGAASREGDATGTTVTTTVTLAVLANDLIVCEVRDGSNTTTLGCADSQGDTFTSRIGPTSNNNNTYQAQMFSAVAAGAGTLTFSGTRSAAGGSIYAVIVTVYRPSASSTWSYDNSGVGAGTDNSGGGTRETSPAFAVTSGSVVIVGAHTADRVTASTAQGTGYTLPAGGVSATGYLAMEYKISATGGTSETTPFTAATVERWLVHGASFKETTSGGAICRPTLTLLGVGQCG